MAEQAQSKLGELFVDIGQTGLGSLVKGLNSLSASFLLGKKGAQEFLKPIVSLNKNALESVRGYDKLSAITGIQAGTFQRLHKWAQLNSVDFSTMSSQLVNLQQNINAIQTNRGGNIKGFALLGIDPRSLDAKDPLKTMDLIKQRVLQLKDANKQAFAMTELGLSLDWLDIWKRGNNLLDERLLLTKQEMAAAREQQNLWNSLKVTWESAIQRILLKQTWLNKALKDCTEWLNNLGVKATSIDKQPWFPELKESLSWIWNILKKIVGALGKLHDAAGAFGRWWGGQQVDDSTLTLMSGLQGNPLLRYQIVKQQQKQMQEYINEAKKNDREITKEQKKQVTKSTQKSTLLPIANPLNASASPEVSTALLTPAQRGELSSYSLPTAPTRNITVNTEVTQNITAPDPGTAADMSSDRIKEQQNQLLEYQYLGGL